MSRLKGLRLHGFKSFADPTRFVFDPGVNAVIGPNGSGKSNMADAIRWVLGEQSNRSLRTRRADDVIFAGSEHRKPQGMAEAILTLENGDGWLPIDFAEVSIGRRTYRSGDSEYLINGARARLRDVVDLLGEGRLGANELVVVGQGTVDAALSLRPEERRQLFEEAAGVKGLQVKRNEASGRLVKSLDNLARVADIVGELKPQVRRLALQAEHQTQHDVLGARARALVTTSHRRREQAARGALGDARRSAAAAEAALESYRSAQDADRAALAAAEVAYWEAEEAARATGSAREETRAAVIRAESRAEAADARRRELAASVARDDAERAAAEQLLASLDDGSADEAVSPALAEAMAAEDAWRSAVAALAAADDRLMRAEEAVATLRAQESDRIAAGARAGEEAARHRVRLEQAVAEHERAASDAAEAETARTEAATAAERATEVATTAGGALEAATARRDEAQHAADAARQAATELDERLRAARAELDAIAEPTDAAVRLGHRLARAGWPSLLDRLEAPAASWPAIEAVVGGELEGALLWSDADPSPQLGGARGAAMLLADGSGRTDAADRAAALAAVGAGQTLADWIGAAATPRALAQTVVAPDLDALLGGWRRLPAGWAAVTVHGDLADARGVVVLRGRGDPPGGAAALAHARRRELGETVGGLEADVRAAQSVAHEATAALRTAREAHLAVRDHADESSRALRRARDVAAEAADRARRLTERIERLAAEREAIASSAPEAQATTLAGTPAAQLDALEAGARDARSQRDALAAARDAARDRWTATRRAAEVAETRVAGQRRERAIAEARLAQLAAAAAARDSSADAVATEQQGRADELTAARSADEAAVASHAAAERLRAERRTALLALEQARGSASGRLAELERAAQATAIEASRRDDALSALARERELALEGLPETEAEAPLDEIEALADEELDAEIRRVRRTLAQIGSVNPFAVDEHRELAGRLEEMTTQETDLRAAIASTEELIGRLDEEIAVQFDTAFRAIAAKFDEFCQLLFAGGSGSLQMADEADGDAPGGIEIVVRPPGKRLQRLAMLSGGERALTGVALLFAMLTVNPVPFCILDEVDAALDEANIGRFAEALRKLSESIDFVVITHNRATIEVADTIYGVTMTDAAVSRVLSLRLADLPAEVMA